MQSQKDLDVHVLGYKLKDVPARVEINLAVGNLRFRSEIHYESIDSWRQVFIDLSGEQSSALLGALIAWDAMRFLALGGERLVLCPGLYVSKETARIWRKCFLAQFGEWRFRNNFQYRTPALPLLVATEGPAEVSSPAVPQPSLERWLVANGGGKDTLAGLILLNETGCAYDIYEGRLPLGGAWKTQEQLLSRLREGAAREGSLVIGVSIYDDFFERTDSEFELSGVHVKHFKSDFSVGHTANYVGYFPLVLAHGYSRIWFNIERSADRSLVFWNGEEISHQWCKSSEYQSLSTTLFVHLTGARWFQGFSSTLRGLDDTLIYSLATSNQAQFLLTHSCNVQKPWCRACAKCCFSYLMISSAVNEEYAKRVLGIGYSLFALPELNQVWRELLDPSQIAWECVASHEECLMALRRLSARGEAPGNLIDIAPNVLAHDDAGSQYEQVDWFAVPQVLRGPLMRKLSEARLEPLTVPVLVVGAGQAGLSVSYELRAAGLSHVVVEGDRIGSSWLRRWNSFRTNTPNRSTALPGFAYSGPDPDGFATGEEIAHLLDDYVKNEDLPVLERCLVTCVSRTNDGFRIETNLGEFVSQVVVVATGEYSQPRLPLGVSELPQSLQILHSANYRSPDQLKPGAALVVGGGQTGAQIVEDLLVAGRTVYWSLSDRPSNVRRIYGKDFMEWWEVGGIIQRPVEAEPDVVEGASPDPKKARAREFPLVSGTGGSGLGHSISLLELERRGVTLLGKFIGSTDETVLFSDNLLDNLEAAIQGSRAELQILTEIAKQYYEDRGKQLPEREDSFIPRELIEPWEHPAVRTEINLKEAGISCVVFATGFATKWPWLKVDGAVDEFGFPTGTQGTSNEPGLYFVGLFNLQRLRARLKIRRRCGLTFGCGKKNIESGRQVWRPKQSDIRAT